MGIYDFTDYRDFLNHHAKKKKEAGLSIGAWAKRLQLKGTSSLSMILSGERDPGPKMIDRFISYFGFNESESLYFKTLIYFSKEKLDQFTYKFLLEQIKTSKLVVENKDLPSSELFKQHFHFKNHTDQYAMGEGRYFDKEDNLLRTGAVLCHWKLDSDTSTFHEKITSFNKEGKADIMSSQINTETGEITGESSGQKFTGKCSFFNDVWSGWSFLVEFPDGDIRRGLEVFFS